MLLTMSNRKSYSTPKQLLTQLHAQAAAILAEGVVLSSFKHRGLSGIEREEPVRRFLRTHLPGRFHVGQGAIASAERILPHQHDIVVADRDLCFMLLNTLNAQLFTIESVHLIVEVRSRHGDLDDVARSLAAVRGLNATPGLRQLGNLGSDCGVTAPPVHTVVIYQGPKNSKLLIDQLTKANSRVTAGGGRLTIDFVLVLNTDRQPTASTGYLVGYSRTDTQTKHHFPHHLYPQDGEEGMSGPNVIESGIGSFAAWYAGLLNHLSGVTVYPPNLYSYLGKKLTFLPWTRKPY